VATATSPTTAATNSTANLRKLVRLKAVESDYRAGVAAGTVHTTAELQPDFKFAAHECDVVQFASSTATTNDGASEEFHRKYSNEWSKSDFVTTSNAASTTASVPTNQLTICQYVPTKWFLLRDSSSQCERQPRTIQDFSDARKWIRVTKAAYENLETGFFEYSYKGRT